MLLFYFLAFHWNMLLTSLDINDYDLAMLPPIEKQMLRLTWTVTHQTIWMMVLYTICQGNYQIQHVAQVCLTKEINRNMCNVLNPPNKESIKSGARNWKKITGLQPTLKVSEASAVPEEWKEIITSPIDAFKAMFSDNLVLHVTLCGPITFMQVIWTFWRMTLGDFLQFYCCQGIAKFHIEVFIWQMRLTHTMKQSHFNEQK